MIAVVALAACSHSSATSPAVMDGIINQGLKDSLGLSPTSVDCPKAELYQLLEAQSPFPKGAPPPFTCQVAFGTTLVSLTVARDGPDNILQTTTQPPMILPTHVEDVVTADAAKVGYDIGVVCPQEPALFLPVGGTFSCTAGAPHTAQTLPLTITVTGMNAFTWAPQPGQPGFTLSKVTAP